MNSDLPILRFFFDAQECFWAGNDLARQRYGYPASIDKLPLTEGTKKELKDLKDWYFYMDNPEVSYRSDVELKYIDRKVQDILEVIEEETKGILIIKDEYDRLSS